MKYTWHAIDRISGKEVGSHKIKILLIRKHNKKMKLKDILKLNHNDTFTSHKGYGSCKLVRRGIQ